MCTGLEKSEVCFLDLVGWLKRTLISTARLRWPEARGEWVGVVLGLARHTMLLGGQRFGSVLPSWAADWVGLVLTPQLQLVDETFCFHVLSKTKKNCPKSWEASQSQDLCIKKSEIHQESPQAVKCVKAGDREVRPTASNRYACVTLDSQIRPRFGTSKSNAPVHGWASVAAIQDWR